MLEPASKKRKRSEDKPHSCHVEGCNATFAGISALAKHIRTHTGEKPYKCDVQDCNASFSRREHLRDCLTIHVIQFICYT